MVSPASISVRANEMGMVDEVCQSALGCGQPDVLSQFVLLLVTGLFTLFVLVAMAHIREARQAVAEERSETATERDAFARFSSRVEALDATPTQSVTSPGAVATATVTANPPNRQLERVKDAYRETVMDVPHYESEYGETLAEHMAAEFGDGVATAILDGSGFTRPVKQALLEASREAQEQRDRFIGTLDHEADELEAAKESFDRVEGQIGATEEPHRLRAFDDLVRAWHRLGDLHDQCDAVLRERQARIQDESMRDGPDDTLTLQEYLYRSLPVSYPVLDAGVELADRLEAARQDVAATITRRG